MSATVLIVDDDETTRDVLGRLLRLKGFCVKCDDGCDAALAWLNCRRRFRRAVGREHAGRGRHRDAASDST